MAYVYGIDVSHHQGHIDFQEVKNSGVKFVLMKVSQRSYKDTKFEEYYKAARAVGLPLGVYIYNKVTTVTEAKDEANFAVECLKGKIIDCGVWLDMEDATMQKLGKAVLTSIINAEARILESAGCNVGIYCNKSWYNSVLDNKVLSAKYPFWIAGYPNNDNGTLKPSLRPNYGCIWQYSSKGHIFGINGHVDLDEASCDIVTLMGGKPLEVPTIYFNPYDEPTVNACRNAVGLTRLLTNPNFRYVSRGDGVKWVQYELQSKGYNIDVDGIFGKETERILKLFQASCKITVDGICGVNTRKFLKK